MPKQRNSADAGKLSFRTLVQACAQEPEIVASFNRACGMDLHAPITPLLGDSLPPELSEEEERQVGCFILFVHETIWQRMKRAQARTRRGLGVH